MATTTADQAIRIPQETDPPDVPLHLGNSVADIEKKLVRVYVNAADRNTKNPSPTNGQMAWDRNLLQLTVYNGTTWVQVYPAVVPAFTSGSSVPSNTSGANGDVFFRV